MIPRFDQIKVLTRSWFDEGGGDDGPHSFHFFFFLYIFAPSFVTFFVFSLIVVLHSIERNKTKCQK